MPAGAPYAALHPPINKGGTNWVTKRGGLPGPIDAIARVLVTKGMDESTAVATAVSQAKKQCATGTAAGGAIKLGPAAQATICAAVTQWEAMKASTNMSAVLDAKTRNALPASAFALPATRQYPIHDIVHARIALSMVKANGTPVQIAQVRAAVKRRYPSITVSDMANTNHMPAGSPRGGQFAPAGGGGGGGGSKSTAGSKSSKVAAARLALQAANANVAAAAAAVKSSAASSARSKASTATTAHLAAAKSSRTSAAAALAAHVAAESKASNAEMKAVAKTDEANSKQSLKATRAQTKAEKEAADAAKKGATAKAKAVRAATTAASKAKAAQNAAARQAVTRDKASAPKANVLHASTVKPARSLSHQLVERVRSHKRAVHARLAARKPSTP